MATSASFRSGFKVTTAAGVRLRVLPLQRYSFAARAA
jgi:hypothetical protein